MDRHHRRRCVLFNKLPQDDPGTGRRSVLHSCGCSSVGRARPRHATWRSGPRVRDSSSAPLRVCPCTPRPRDRVLVVRDVRGPWPGPVQRDTTSDGMLAFGHSRSGLSVCRVRLDGRGHRAFIPGTRVRIPHATPGQIAEIAQQVERRVEGACVGGSKPSLGTSNQNLVSSAGFRAPVYEAGGRTFESCTRCHPTRRSQVAEGVWLQTRWHKPASVRIGPSSPLQIPDSAVGRAPGCSPGGPWFEATSGSHLNLGVAQQAARVFREHEAAGSKPATETNCQRALGCDRSSMAELRDVTPPVPVRSRPVTPKRMQFQCVANSSGRVPGS